MGTVPVAVHDSDQSQTTSSTTKERFISVGYHDVDPDHNPAGCRHHHHCSIPIWSTAGNVSGTVWLKLVTDAPVEVVTTRLRFLGPLLVLVQVWGGATKNAHEQDHQNASGAHETTKKTVTLSDSQTLEEATAEIRRLVESTHGGGSDDYAQSFAQAVTVWADCVQCSWPSRGSGRAKEIGGTSEPVMNLARLKFRVSCVRNDSKHARYARQQLHAAITDWLVPDVILPTTTTTTTLSSSSDWTVDLTHFDLEVVALMRPHALAVGLAVRPYVHMGAKSFAAGSSMPPDVCFPYYQYNAAAAAAASTSSFATGQPALASNVIRLRPSTAQVLLHLAQLQPGEVVLDPCVGIGTIPLETLFTKSSVLAVGGDLILSDQSIAPTAESYVQHARHSSSSSSSSSVMDLLAWDACQLPLRSETVDVIISDLPFGQTCLSSAKLSSLLPLMISEMARVLRRTTGRAVLLCGSHLPVLEVLQQQQQNPTRDVRPSTGTAASPSAVTSHANNPVKKKCDLNNHDTTWQLPCSSVFPINVGGLLAWVILVRRGSAPHQPLPRYAERLRKVANNRERNARYQRNNNGDNHSQGSTDSSKGGKRRIQNAN